MIVELQVHGTRHGRKRASRLDVAAAGAHFARRVVVHQDETFCLHPEGMLEQVTISRRNGRGACAAGDPVPTQLSLRIVEHFENHLMPQSTHGFHKDFEEGYGKRFDPAAKRHQVCHDGSEPLRRSRRMCRNVPTRIATMAPNVGAPRMMA